MASGVPSGDDLGERAGFGFLEEPWVGGWLESICL